MSKPKKAQSPVFKEGQGRMIACSIPLTPDEQKKLEQITRSVTPYLLEVILNEPSPKSQ